MTSVVRHTPVLSAEVEQLAAGRSAIVDCTAGGGGHLGLFLDLGARVLAIDRDPAAVATIRARFGDAASYRCGRFADPHVLAAVAAHTPDFVFLDLGVSSTQLDDDSRGFSFRPGVALDMRMDPTDDRLTAADFLNEAAQDDLRRVFADHADERRASALARTIVRRRERAALRSSDDLVNAIRAALGPRSGPGDFARLFQAVRMEVNDELPQLRAALPAYRDALCPGGDVAVITYHSGEDRVVKNAFRDWGRSCICPKGVPMCVCRGRPLGNVLTKKPVLPTMKEIDANPRARSAKLRVYRHGEDL